MTFNHHIKNKRDVIDQLLTICSKIIDDNIFQNNTNRSTLQQFRHARKALIGTRIESFHTRQVFLDHLQCSCIDSGEVTQAHVINQIQKSEKRKQCWRTFKLLRKGPQTTGGISRVLVPNVISHSTTKHI
jgi:hypothetical protein